MIFLSSGAVLAVTTSAFCAYEFLTFRQSSVQQLQTLSQAIASNSTAALAFDNADDAAAILAAVGLYGVLSYGIARRTNEIAIRIALGAQSRGVVAMILREAGCHPGRASAAKMPSWYV